MKEKNSAILFTHLKSLAFLLAALFVIFVVGSSNAQYEDKEISVSAPDSVEVEIGSQTEFDVNIDVTTGLAYSESVAVNIENDIQLGIGAELNRSSCAVPCSVRVMLYASSDVRVGSKGVLIISARRKGQNFGNIVRVPFTVTQDEQGTQEPGAIPIDIGSAPNIPTIFPCHMLSGSAAVPDGFGAVYDVFSTVREQLMGVSCNSRSNTASVALGGAGEKNRYIYNSGYILRSGEWSQIKYSGQESVGSWLKDSAFAEISLSKEEFGQKNYILAYMCTLTDSGFKCGCSDSACRTPHWQLQVFIGSPPL